MTNKQNPKFLELVAKLREIFQIDRPELDFGIYRILNARAGEINDYLQNRLAEKVQVVLSAGSAASAQKLQAELQEAEKNAQALGVSPDSIPKVQELRAKLKETAAGSSEHENGGCQFFCVRGAMRLFHGAAAGPFKARGERRSGKVGLHFI